MLHAVRNSDRSGRVADPRVGLLKLLADPLRLRVVDRLGQGGPATVSRLAAELQVPLPQLSNHLRRLREAGLVRVERAGRQAVYELADPGLELLLPLLDRLAGRVTPSAVDPRALSIPSRTCYDHLAGPVGVVLYRALRDRHALRERADGMVDLAETAAETFAALGVDPSAIQLGRQRVAFECLDTTERAPHLAGALGDALASTLLARRWLRREGGGRTIRITAQGARGLHQALGIEVPPDDG
jgi:DNA-binding transcriptional ArsR family regulator